MTPLRRKRQPASTPRPMTSVPCKHGTPSSRLHGLRLSGPWDDRGQTPGNGPADRLGRVSSAALRASCLSGGEATSRTRCEEGVEKGQTYVTATILAASLPRSTRSSMTRLTEREADDRGGETNSVRSAAIAVDPGEACVRA